MRSGLRDANVWGILPGTSDEDIIVMAHHDGYFESAMDNASGVAVMLALAEHFSKIPKAQRRRTIKFVSTSGHHAGSLGTRWMHDNRDTFLAKTALILNSEHVTATAAYMASTYSPGAPRLQLSDNREALYWWVNGSNKLASLILNAHRTFGVTLYADMDPIAPGDMSAVARDVPTHQVIQAPVWYHTDYDRPDMVPDAGLEAAARAFAKIIDEVNKLDRRELLPETLPPTSAAKGGR
jgi:hypothetical protein